MQVVMHTEVVASLSSFLEAIPAQVQTWDLEVVEYLSSNAQLFQEFKIGSDVTKWDIYSMVRRRRPH